MNTTQHNSGDVAERLQLCLPHLPLNRPHETLIKDLRLDSLDSVELLCVIHAEFGVRITDSDVHQGQTIEGLIAAITSKLNR